MAETDPPQPAEPSEAHQAHEAQELPASEPPALAEAESTGQPRQVLGLVDELASRLETLRQWETQSQSDIQRWRDAAEAAQAKRAEAEQQLSELQQQHGQLEEREQALQRRERELSEREAQLNDQRQQLDRRASELNRRETDLAQREQTLAQQQQALETAQHDIERDKQRIAKRKDQLQYADQVIQRRREKIKKQVRWLRRHREAAPVAPDTSPEPDRRETLAEPAGSPTSGESPTIDQEPGELTGAHEPPASERRELAEVKKLLERTERQMMRKWATQRAGSLMSGIILAVLAMAGASYFAAWQLVPATWQGVATFEADAADGTAPALEAAGPAKQTLLADEVLNETLSRMDRAGVSRFTRVKPLREHLRQRVTFEANAGRLTLTYRSTRPSAVRPMVQALAQAYLAHQKTEVRAAGQTPTLGLAGAIARRPLAVTGQRLETAGLFFAGLGAVALTILLIARILAARTPSVFDEADPALQTLDDPQVWSPVGGHSSQ
jgi:hypothetical protein